MRYVLTFREIITRYVCKRANRLMTIGRKPLTWAEIVSAVLVWGETANLFRAAHLFANAGQFVHPIAASATLLALVAHLPE